MTKNTNSHPQRAKRPISSFKQNRAKLKALHPNIPQRMLEEDESAVYIGMSPSFLRQGRAGNTKVKPPSHVKIGRNVRYRVEDLDEWIEQFARVTGEAE